jgi:hypothetical protein
LCDLCHGGTNTKDGSWSGAEIGSIDYTKGGEGGTTASNYALWISGYNGHANVVIDGLGRGADDSAESYARNIFTRVKRGSANRDQDNNNTRDELDMGGGTYTDSGRLYSYRGRQGGSFLYLPYAGGTTNTNEGDDEPRAQIVFSWNQTYHTGGATAHERSAGTMDLEIGGMAATNDDAQVEAANYDSQANYHTFNCGKCHNPHASRLPKLMITNCLDTNHNTWDNTAAFSAATSTNVAAVWRNSRHSQWPSAQNCHRLDNRASFGTGGSAESGNETTVRGTGWNKVTPWWETDTPD